MPTQQQNSLNAALIHLDGVISAALRSVPGSTELRRFGSLHCKTGDCYSDLDYQLFTTDPNQVLRTVLTRVDPHIPVEAAYRIDTHGAGWAASLITDKTSLFHKVDLGVLPVDRLDDWLRGHPSTLVWKQPAFTACDERINDVPAFIPEPGTQEHYILGELLSATRYVKARKRGQILTCWRFASSLVRSTLKIRLAHVTNQAFDAVTLSTEDYLTADRLFSTADRVMLLQHADFSSNRSMDHCVQQCVANLLELSASAAIPPTLRARFRHFIEAELAEASDKSLHAM
jgi:hypothetical protein